jgi:hypothetical protein
MAETLVMVFAVLAFFGLVSSFVNGVKIGLYLEKQNIKINWWLYRFLIFKYVKQYKKMTRQPNGDVGPLYYRFFYSSLFVAVCLSITILLLVI